MSNTSGADDAVDENVRAAEIEDFLLTRVVPSICVIGLLGNILNLMVLSHRSWQIALGRMERFPHSGLIGLAVSDLLFCLAVLPHFFVNLHAVGYNRLEFGLVFQAFRDPVISTCVLSSTMLTVAIAIGRYFAIVHPIRAREVIGMTLTRRVLGSVTLFSVCVNLPRFWMLQIRTIDCHDGSYLYYVHAGPLKHHEMLYKSIYFVIAVCVPLVVLTFCNVHLLRALKQTFDAPIQCRGKEKSRDSNFRITLSLVIIIIAFGVLVLPGEASVFLRLVLAHTEGATDRFNLPIAVLSCMQALNFSFNFVLYCAVNTHFRRTIRNVLHCRWVSVSKRKQKTVQYDSLSTEGGPNTMRMSVTGTTKVNCPSTTVITDNG